MNDTSVQLVVAAFDEKNGAEDALAGLKEAKELTDGIHAAIAIQKDENGALHFKDVGLTPSKGAVGGLVLGAVIGVFTGGTGLALGALGAIIGGAVGRKKRDSGIPTASVNQIAASLPPGSSAIVLVAEERTLAALVPALEEQCVDLLVAPIAADLIAQLGEHQDSAHTLMTGVLGKDEDDAVDPTGHGPKRQLS